MVKKAVNGQFNIHNFFDYDCNYCNCSDVSLGDSQKSELKTLPLAAQHVCMALSFFFLKCQSVLTFYCKLNFGDISNSVEVFYFILNFPTVCRVINDYIWCVALLMFDRVDATVRSEFFFSSRASVHHAYQGIAVILRNGRLKYNILWSESDQVVPLNLTSPTHT